VENKPPAEKRGPTHAHFFGCAGMCPGECPCTSARARVHVWLPAVELHRENIVYS